MAHTSRIAVLLTECVFQLNPVELSQFEKGRASFSKAAAVKLLEDVLACTAILTAKLVLVRANYY